MLTAGGGGLAGVDVADDHDVDVNLLLTERVISDWFQASISDKAQAPSEGDGAHVCARGKTHPMMAVDVVDCLEVVRVLVT